MLFRRDRASEHGEVNKVDESSSSGNEAATSRDDLDPRAVIAAKISDRANGRISRPDLSMGFALASLTMLIGGQLADVGARAAIIVAVVSVFIGVVTTVVLTVKNSRH